jgi:hypothetical protein
MLYQLSVYALSHAGSEMATILYPTTSPAAREARIVIRGPTGGGRRGLVALRPVRLDELADLLAMRPSVEAMRRRCTLARQLVYGSSVAS